MQNDDDLAAARERLRSARERAVAAEIIVSGAREELGAAAGHLEMVRGFQSIAGAGAQEPPVHSQAVTPANDGVPDSWPYRTQSKALPPPAYVLTARTSTGSKESELPRAREPAGWSDRRTGITWGVIGIALGASLLFHWLSQVLVGFLVGATTGIEGIRRITLDDLASLNVTATFCTLIISTVVIVLAALRTYRGLSWAPGEAHSYGMSWWRNCWAPILLGTGAYALIFWIAFLSATTEG